MTTAKRCKITATKQWTTTDPKCLSEGGVQHVFSTSEEVLMALELVAKTLRISRRPLLCSSNFASFCCCHVAYV